MVLSIKKKSYFIPPPTAINPNILFLLISPFVSEAGCCDSMNLRQAGRAGVCSSTKRLPCHFPSLSTLTTIYKKASEKGCYFLTDTPCYSPTDLESPVLAVYTSSPSTYATEAQDP
jgi:hypothetical protein